jgi:dienelactone hydrolase
MELFMKKILMFTLFLINFIYFNINSIESKLTNGIEIEKNIIFYKVFLNVDKNTLQETWIYTPKIIKNKSFCIFVPPAGSNLVLGMKLSEGDMQEHLPYARNGMIVVSFDITGYLENNSGKEVINKINLFKDYESGLRNLKTSLDFIIEQFPQIDANKILIAGHSSAATLSLYVTSKESRIKGCLAYAPEIIIKNFLKTDFINILNSQIKNFDNYIDSISPENNFENLNCPIFLFYSKEDQVININDIDNFYVKIKKKNKFDSLFIVNSGDHFNSMIDDGIDNGIKWINSIWQNSR